ncbi:carboxypeptidase regulatory-like domain-containing protein [Methanocalculus sp.]|uniref:carboxypeptidase regulatory-like domain-containing protein n=1 Tax=Methanocalculus sp. TaxID=2004547 RepID=UPI002638AC2A|nr:carboxypeptidase regulatory-like domain-containing protein [Methanocalculus sp.]MDG6249479.1 hypothetical protein [Methanocalculus sp.]
MNVKQVLFNKIKDGISLLGLDKKSSYNLIFLFLFIVVIIGFIVPTLSYGQLFGTDEYTHLFHSNQMCLSDSLAEFYQSVSGMVSNPDDPNAPYTYPFALWLLGGTIAKIIGADPHTASYLYGLISIFILLMTFYLYSDIFLKTKTQKLLALLFLLSMPTIALIAVNFRPSSTVLPFVLMSLYCALGEKFDWKFAIMMIVSVFIITIMHTGTFIFLISLSLAFLILYSLIWGKFSKPMFLLSVTMLFVYVIAVLAFPYIHPQYIDKATMFLTPGNFLTNNLYIPFAADLSSILYTNLFVEAQFTYVILLSALIYSLCLICMFVHRRVTKHVVPSGSLYQIAVLPTNLSKGLASIPIWLGPIHVLLSCFGFFRLDAKGKSLMVAALAVCIFPEFQRSLEDISISTGALRNISYLVIIIPIAAVFGTDYLISWFKKTREKESRTGEWILGIMLVLLFASFIVIPALGTSYYQPRTTGEDHVIDGMKWLSNIGNFDEGVSGYGLRTTPIFTEKNDIYHLSYGGELKNYQNLLRNCYFGGSEQAAQKLSSNLGIKYILISDKIAANLGGDQSEMHVNANTAVDRIYSGRDFGIYRSVSSAQQFIDGGYIGEDITMLQSGSDFIVESDSYKITLSAVSPQITYIGTKKTNYLDEGHILDFITTTSADGERTGHNIFEIPFSANVDGNSIVYTRFLQNATGNVIGTVDVTYSFYQNTIRCETVVSNDWSDALSGMQVSQTTRFFSPITEYVLFGDGGRIVKRVYPSEDGSNLNEKFHGIYLQNDHSGIYIEYLPDSPYPLDLFYSGSVRYNDYCLLQIKRETLRSLAPGASLKFVQYISIGDEGTARRRVEDQRRIELHPYADGVIPMAIVENSIYTTRYDLSAIKMQADKGVSYLITDSISPPYLGILWDEGFRHPQMASYQGSATDLVMLPVSNPPSTSLSTEEPEGVFQKWKAVIDSVAENNDMALFVFRAMDIEKPEYNGMFNDLFDYAIKRGLTTTTPEAIADHYRKMQKVSFTASHELDSAFINVRNSNPEPVSGVTLRVVMPLLEEAEYRVTGGNVANLRNSGDSVIIYASADFAPHETRTITIEPETQRKKFIVDVPEYVIEHKVSITVRGEDGKPISNAYVTFEGFPIPFETDVNGKVQAELSRGSYRVTVEKAGYLKQAFTMEVRGRVYALHHLIYDIL